MNSECRGKIIVEIGPGGCPVNELFSEVSKQIINGTASYFAIDNLCTSENFYRKPSVWGTIESIPILSGNIDELWLMNVFTDLDIRRELGSPYRTKNGGELIISRSSECYFSELARVLKPGGIINIGEHYGPGLDSLRWLTAVSYRDFGLEKEVFTGRGIWAFLEKYKIKEDLVRLVVNPHGFFMTLTKKDD